MVAFKEPLHIEMAKVRAASAQARREAFVQYRSVVCGIMLEPVTLRTYTAMVALGNAFAHPDTDGGYQDIANFIWIHHPGFSQTNARERKRLYRQVRRYLFRGLWRINDTIRAMRPTLPKWSRAFVTLATRETVADFMNVARTEIKRLVAEAVEELPTGDTTDDTPALFAWEARILSSFRRMYRMPYSETQGIPLKQLAQLMREAVDHNSSGKDPQYTAKEAAIICEDMDRKNAAAWAAASEDERAAILAQRKQDTDDE